EQAPDNHPRRRGRRPWPRGAGAWPDEPPAPLRREVRRPRRQDRADGQDRPGLRAEGDRQPHEDAAVADGRPFPHDRHRRAHRPRQGRDRRDPDRDPHVQRGREGHPRRAPQARRRSPGEQLHVRGRGPEGLPRAGLHARHRRAAGRRAPRARDRERRRRQVAQRPGRHPHRRGRRRRDAHAARAHDHAPARRVHPHAAVPGQPRHRRRPRERPRDDDDEAAQERAGRRPRREERSPV
ncbi:MAG: hypothetical protein AVDCRST_MAG85-4125, partial [uncultured Solirubrobacteraceae bacterium]